MVPRLSLFVIALFVLPVASLAQLRGHWNSAFANAGVQGQVYTLLAQHDTLYAGGAFTTIGGVSANHIAMFDGTAWHPLGGGVNGSVWSLAFDVNGNLLAGGSFDTAGAAPAHSVARWNQSSWSSMGQGVLAPYLGVHAILVTSQGEIYIGGDFDYLGDSVLANSVAHWNGSNWEAMGSGIQRWRGALPVWSLVQTPRGIAAGGFYMAAGGKSGSGISFWKDGAWSTPAFTSEAEVHLTSLTTLGDSLVFCGELGYTTFPSSPGVGYLSGASAGVLPPLPFNPGVLSNFRSGIATAVSPIGVPPDSSQTVAYFDRSTNSWELIPGGIGGTAQAITSDGNQIYISGYFGTAAGIPSQGIAEFTVDQNADVAWTSETSSNQTVVTNGRLELGSLSSFVRVFDIVGREMPCGTVTNSGRTELNLSGLPRGVYFVCAGAEAIRVLVTN